MKDQKESFEAKYPSKEFNKIIYSFNSEELRKLSSLDTINQMGQMAQMMINNLVQGECLVRVKAKNSPDTGVLYDIPKGEFHVFVPKVWCSKCGNRKSMYEYKGANYCNDCLNLVKALEGNKNKPKK